MSQEEAIKKKANPPRINNTILGPAESRSIHWFVGIAPDWVSPDQMTIIGMIGSILVFVGYALTPRSSAFLWLASFGFFLNWFGDSLDGNIARIRHIERPRYGYFVDHSLDTIGMLFIFVGLGLTPHINMLIALSALISYLLMGIYVYINTQVNKEFQISYAKLGPTEGRLILVIGNIVMYFVGMHSISLLNFQFSIYDIFFMICIIFLLILFFGNVFKGIIKLYKEEPPVKYTSPDKRF